MRKIIQTDKGPKALAFYSQAIVHNGVVYVAGQVPLDPATGELVQGDVQVQAERVLENVKAILEAAGSGMEHALKVSVFLQDINDFARMNEIYGRAELIVAKQRHGATGIVRMRFDSRITKFSDPVDEGYLPEMRT